MSRPYRPNKREQRVAVCVDCMGGCLCVVARGVEGVDEAIYAEEPGSLERELWSAKSWGELSGVVVSGCPCPSAVLCYAPSSVVEHFIGYLRSLCSSLAAVAEKP